jgi:hypothetical protein
MHNVPIASGGNIATRDITDQWMNKDYMLKKSEITATNTIDVSLAGVESLRQSSLDCLNPIISLIDRYISDFVTM